MDISAAQLFDDMATSLLLQNGVNPEEMPFEIFDQMKAEIVVRLITFINMVIIDNIPDENIEEYQNLIIQNEQEKALVMCKDKISNFQELINTAITEFSATYLDKK